jgi:hypothetical protein
MDFNGAMTLAGGRNAHLSAEFCGHIVFSEGVFVWWKESSVHHEGNSVTLGVESSERKGEM